MGSPPKGAPYAGEVVKRWKLPILATQHWARADPGVQAVSPQMTIRHPPGSSLLLLSARRAVTFPATEHHRLLAGTKLYCLVTEAHRCEQLAQGCYATLPRVGFELTTCWSQVQRSTSCVTVPLQVWRLQKDDHVFTIISVIPVFFHLTKILQMSNLCICIVKWNYGNDFSSIKRQLIIIICCVIVQRFHLKTANTNKLDKCSCRFMHSRAVCYQPLTATSSAVWRRRRPPANLVRWCWLID